MVVMEVMVQDKEQEAEKVQEPVMVMELQVQELLQ